MQQLELTGAVAGDEAAKAVPGTLRSPRAQRIVAQARPMARAAPLQRALAPARLQARRPSAAARKLHPGQKV
eukprot:4684107-Pyramimonas_sp.AAC.1